MYEYKHAVTSPIMNRFLGFRVSNFSLRDTPLSHGMLVSIRRRKNPTQEIVRSQRSSPIASKMTVIRTVPHSLSITGHGWGILGRRRKPSLQYMLKSRAVLW